MRLPSALQSVIPIQALAENSNDGEVGLRRRTHADQQLRRWNARVLELFDYQSDVVDGLSHLAKSSLVRGMVMMPTGSGKTLTATSYLLRQMCGSEREGELCVWIAPQYELLSQAATTFERMWSSGCGPDSLDLCYLSSESEVPAEGRPAVLFATPMMAERCLARNRACSRIRHLVFDEAHHLGAEKFGDSWRDLISSAGRLRSAIGMSATPTRSDMSSFDDLQSALGSQIFFPRRLMPDPISELVSRGVLATVNVRPVPGIPAHYRSQRLSTRDANKALTSDADVWMACITSAATFEGPLVVYCPERESGALFAKHLRAIGVKAEFIDGTDSYDVRVSALERFRDRRTSVLVSVQLLYEGIDAPAAAGALITYRIQSPIRLTQVLGRVMRGSRLGGTAVASILCSDHLVERDLRLTGASRDFGAYWSKGTPL